jgi:hypothetical protein
MPQSRSPRSSASFRNRFQLVKMEMLADPTRQRRWSKHEGVSPHRQHSEKEKRKYKRKNNQISPHPTARNLQPRQNLFTYSPSNITPLPRTLSPGSAPGEYEIRMSIRLVRRHQGCSPASHPHQGGYHRTALQYREMLLCRCFPLSW